VRSAGNSLAVRSMSLILIEFWQAKGRLGSLTEDPSSMMLRASSGKEDSRQRTFVLSEARARRRRRAARGRPLSSCKQQQSKFRMTLSSPSMRWTVQGMSPERLAADEVAALLSRPLFDSATYGRRCPISSPGASPNISPRGWFAKRMAEGCPTHVLLQYLFRRLAPGSPRRARASSPSPRGFVSVMQNGTVDVRARVAEGCPDILFQYGDAAALPLALQAIAPQCLDKPEMRGESKSLG